MTSSTREVVVDTSVLQYLHQLGLLHLLRELYDRVWVPAAVVDELEAGRRLGFDLPHVTALSWLDVRRVTEDQAKGPPNLGLGEREVIALAESIGRPLVLLDDRGARQIAGQRDLQVSGTLGVLVRARKLGRIGTLTPLLERLEALRFRLDARTRAAVLRMVDE